MAPAADDDSVIFRHREAVVPPVDVFQALPHFVSRGAEAAEYSADPEGEGSGILSP